MHREFDRIAHENLRIQDKIGNVKSDYARKTILKSSSELLSHRSHLMKFKPQDRFKIKLPPIMKKEQKVTLLGLNFHELSSEMLSGSLKESKIEMYADGQDVFKNNMYEKGAF